MARIHRRTKDLHDSDNHEAVITHREADILECEVKWVLGSITMNQASGGAGIPVERSQILKDDAVELVYSICQQMWKTQQWPQNSKWSVFILIPGFRKAGFRKGRGTRDQIAKIFWIIEKAREFQRNIYFCFIDYCKAFDCVDHNKLWKILQEMGIPDHLTCLLRNL